MITTDACVYTLGILKLSQIRTLGPPNVLSIFDRWISWILTVGFSCNPALDRCHGLVIKLALCGAFGPRID